MRLRVTRQGFVDMLREDRKVDHARRFRDRGTPSTAVVSGYCFRRRLLSARSTMLLWRRERERETDRERRKRWLRRPPHPAQLQHPSSRRFPTSTGTCRRVGRQSTTVRRRRGGGGRPSGSRNRPFAGRRARPSSSSQSGCRGSQRNSVGAETRSQCLRTGLLIVSSAFYAYLVTGLFDNEHDELPRLVVRGL